MIKPLLEGVFDVVKLVTSVSRSYRTIIQPILTSFHRFGIMLPHAFNPIYVTCGFMVMVPQGNHDAHNDKISCTV